jgi:histidyl-tRNA synthetase
MVQEAEGIAVEEPRPDVFVVSAGEGAMAEVRKLVADLRTQGFAIALDIEGRSMKSQLKQADKSGARYAVILGDDELANDSATLRDLQSSDQRSVPRAQLVSELR